MLKARVLSVAGASVSIEIVHQKFRNVRHELRLPTFDQDGPCPRALIGCPIWQLRKGDKILITGLSIKWGQVVGRRINSIEILKLKGGI